MAQGDNFQFIEMCLLALIFFFPALGIVIILLLTVVIMMFLSFVLESRKPVMLGEPGLSCSCSGSFWLASRAGRCQVGERGDVLGLSGPSNSCRKNMVLPPPGRLLADHAPPLAGS